MTQHATTVLTTLANESGKHENLNALGAGIGALATLLILLFVVTRFNKDR
ncbi:MULTISPECIES: hypothetical protein [Embleya]|uniref:Uncharacterized protein n=1 Tax=Embleya hyalina TaxID=516124 RepID=A0A401YPH9_9ACTN|nr:hypothetical protein [Embleya hyalina]GCD96503.1 hypothetical protein EHYA_04190 [Embleya hyalina]